MLEHAAHLLLVAAEGAADRDPVDAGRGDALRRSLPQVLVDAALDDPEDRLAPRPVRVVPVEAAVEPAVGALGRARGVVAVGVEGRALVEDEGDVGAQRGLDPHRLLRAQEPLGAVDVGAEAHPLLGDVEDRAVPAALARWRLRAAPPLTSSATSPWASEKTWKPPESVMIARSQPMNSCRPPSASIRSPPARASGGRCCRGPSRSRARRPRPTSASEPRLRRQRHERRASRPARAAVTSARSGRRRRPRRSRSSAARGRSAPRAG